MSGQIATSNAITISKSYGYDGFSETLGTSNYTLLIYCPILSHLTVTSTTPSGGVASTIAGLQPSGLAVNYAQDQADPIFTINNWFGWNNSTAGATGAAAILSGASLYGFSSDTNMEVFQYAGKLSMRFVVPAANLTGTYYKGKVRLGQLVDGLNGSHTGGNPGTWSVQDFIRVADEVDALKSGFELQSSLVNDYLLTHTLRNGGDVVGPSATNQAAMNDVDLGAEIVEFVLLQTPSKNITTGANATYTLIGEAEINSVILPNLKNILMYRTFRPFSHGKQTKEIDFQYMGSPPADARAPTNVTQLKSFEHKLANESEAGSNQSDASSLMPVNLIMPHINPIPNLGDEESKHDLESDDIISTISEDNFKPFMTRRQGALYRLASQLHEDKEFNEFQDRADHALKMGLPMIATIGSAVKLLIDGLENAPAIVKTTKNAYENARTAFGEIVKTFKGRPKQIDSTNTNQRGPRVPPKMSRNAATFQQAQAIMNDKKSNKADLAWAKGILSKAPHARRKKDNDKGKNKKK